MPNRTHEIFTGKTFKVPTHIVRLDSKSTHGWQLRYGPSKLFSDHTSDGSGAAKSLKLAKEELALRLEKLPAPTGLRVDTRKGKMNNMPLGISGPVSRVRAGRGVTQHYLQVTFPVFGDKPVNRSIYIATEATLTKEKFDQAMERAIAVRAAGVRKFKLASTKLQRGEPVPAVAAPTKKAAAKKVAAKKVATQKPTATKAAARAVVAPKPVAKKAASKPAAKKPAAKKAAARAKPPTVSMKSLIKAAKPAKAAAKVAPKTATKPAPKAVAKVAPKAAPKAAKKAAKKAVAATAKPGKTAKARKSK